MKYILCTCPRTGSGLICLSLQKMGIGFPDEYFNLVEEINNEFVERKELKDLSLEEYCKFLIQKHTVNGVFGLSLHFRQINQFPELIEKLPEYFPDAKYISFTRKNILRQAISFVRATQTEAWASDLTEKRKPHFDSGFIKNSINDIFMEMSGWEDFYRIHKIDPLRIVYEDIETDYFNVMKAILNYLNVDKSPPPQQLKKQADHINDEWYDKLKNKIWFEIDSTDISEE